MNIETHPAQPSEMEGIQLLEHPELWPEDPAVQAELAALLEIHLALIAHGQSLVPSLTKEPQPRWHQAPWLPLAAAILLAVLPSMYALRHMRMLQAQSKDQARIELVARSRAQERLWSAFFQQSSSLLKDFQRTPANCRRDREDRTNELFIAQTLLRASHQLAAQGSPSTEAEALRADLHGWLMEFSLEDGCLAPERAEELRQLAAHRDLEDASLRLSRLLNQGGD